MITCPLRDIRDFQPLTAVMEPEEVMDILLTFHETLGGLMAESGDGIEAFLLRH